VLGGVAEKTRDAIALCEAAGYDVVMVETVGVGQSEVAVQAMTDMFVLMQLPHAGDDLQALKKGVMELADLVLINKADLDRDAALRAKAQISSSLRLMRQSQHASHGPPRAPVWQARPLLLSALSGAGVAAFWDVVMQFKTRQQANGQWLKRRQNQALHCLTERIEAGLKQAFYQHPQVQQHLPQLRADVMAGRLAASAAAAQLLKMARTPESAHDLPPANPD
jgi:LAO/AO transport system kinase